ncbi:MAG: GNAT family N-acetyltransferase [Thermoleophilia bacterium]|nr:GNAT family N-acetyltransferase [Thermoleophilia bacterium]
MPEISVRRLTPALLDDWLAFFDHDAFADNPDWAGCYCRYFHFDHEERDFSTTTEEENRAASIELIGAGRLRGYLAYDGGRPVGWCQAAPRSEIPNIAKDPELAGDGEKGVGSIVCFTVAATHRRQGVAAGLLEAACAGFQDEGREIAEAYPIKRATGDAHNYHGPLALYLHAGFDIYREAGDVVVVRRRLAGPSGSARGPVRG